ncbi:uncharacterized protein LOC131235659 [Magnolia sinica]|uniref:uncharacterized protein LOC131235659 n=1 Tax=Magnolia sinica TaxID=86752 RepID=UPI0026590402|nr:uncharacterized protein LOC131235659 [Magnolia sinica]
MAKENAIEMELKEDVMSHLPPSKLKDELIQKDEKKKNKNKNKNMNLDDLIMEADIVYSIIGLCELSDPKNIVIKRSHPHLEEGRIEDKKLERKLEPLGLKVNQIKQDKHCLFRAVEDQLALYSVRAS